MKDRIKEIMERLGMSQQDFAARLGVSPASLSSIFTGRTNPTNNHVMAIHKAFPRINVSWLMFGEGDMYVGENLQAEENDTSREPGDVGEPVSVYGADVVYSDGSSMPSMFAGESIATSGVGQPVGHTIPQSSSQSRLDKRMRERRDIPVVENVKIVDRPMRKIKEIRVFFDDGTYEAFVPSVK